MGHDASTVSARPDKNPTNNPMKTLLSKPWLFLLSVVFLSCPLALAQSAGPGTALNLDGASGYAQATNGVWFNGNFTVEGWVYARSYNNWSRLIDFANGPNTYNVFLALSGGTGGFPVFGVYTNNNGLPNFTANTQLPLNQWAHLAATLNGTTGTIYINGVNVGSGTLNLPPNVVRTNNYIGRSNYGVDAYANALFDEVRIWNVARNTNQIQAFMHRSLAGSETGLLGYWRMDEGAGTTLIDSSGHGQTGTLFGGTSWSNSTAPLTVGPGTALNFNSTNCQTVTIPHQSALNAYPLTVMTWFMVPTNSNGGALVNKYVSSSKNGYQIFLAGDLRAWYFRDQNNNVFNNGVMDAGPVNDGKWHHAAMAVDATGGRLYLDGVLKSSVAWSGTPGATTTTQPLSLGIYPGDSCFSGQLDEVSIWNTALSTAQIQNFMHKSLQGTESGLLAYYRLDEGGGTTTVDGTGNGYNGTLNGPPTWIPSGAILNRPPTVTNQPATSVTVASAALNGTVVPNGSDTTAWFFYGTTTNYGSSSASIIVSGTNLAAVPVSSLIGGLSAGTTYHFELVASNSAGTTAGSDLAFTTAPAFTAVSSGLPVPADYGMSAAWGDFNNDGRLDVVTENMVSRNNGNGTFSQVSIGTPSRLGNGAQAWGDVDNDGYLDLLITGDLISNNDLPITQLWHNNGNGTFTLVNNTGLPNLENDAIAFGDFDNDGRQDVLLIGTDGKNSDNTAHLNSGIWHNNGDGTFTKISMPGLPAIWEGAVACGDFDNDGYLDFLITGQDSNNSGVTQMWRNNGDGTFTKKIIAGLPQPFQGSLAVGDYNGDGRLDFLLTGQLSGTSFISQVWSNGGNWSFTQDTQVTLPGLYLGTAIWGDFDNDGKLDILLSGGTAESGFLPVSPVTQVWRNLGGGQFADMNAGMPAVRYQNAAACGDFNNDGKLDALLVGFSPLGFDMNLFLEQNNSPTTNTPPTAPSGLQAAVSGSGVLLTWNAATDAQTASAGLSYNIRVGSTPGGSDIVSPQADPATGFRRVPQLGNAQERLTAILTNLHSGTYYWSVQAIDTAFAGSSFAAEAQFTVTNGFAYAPIVTTLPASSITTNTATLNASVNPGGGLTFSWFRYGATSNYDSATPATNAGSGLTVFSASAVLSSQLPGSTIHYQAVATNAGGSGFGQDLTFTLQAGAPVISDQSGGSIYPPTSALLNATLQSGGADTTAWFEYGTDTNYGLTTPPANFSGTNTALIPVSVLVSNLSVQTLYYFRMVASNTYGITIADSTSFIVPSFATVASGLPTPIDYKNSAAWGDFNNDGFLDVLMGNLVSSNNGNGTFSQLAPGLPARLGFGAQAWADYDNDGLLDFLITGSPGFDVQGFPTYLTQLWHNNGDGTFTQVPAPGLPNIDNSSVAFGDFDNDGRPDILMMGQYGVTPSHEPEMLCGIWHNNGDGTFTEISIPGLAAIWQGAVACGDFDNDGYLDFIIAGADANNTARIQMWRNLGNGSFAQVSIPGLASLYNPSIAVGDFNNDGHLDFLLSGNSPGAVSQLWSNNWDGTFTLVPQAGLPGLFAGAAAWGDFDSDGKPDLLLSGATYQGNSGIPSGGFSQVWRNMGGGSFSDLTSLQGFTYSGAAWGDYDNDGRLDVLLFGQPTQPILAQNFSPATNTPPTAPAGLQASVNGFGVVLHWNAATDAQTPAAGLSYNIRVGTTPGGFDIVSPEADTATGFRRVPQLGNAQERLMAILTNLPVATYYWSVQAIDTSFAGSPFSSESQFTLGIPTAVTEPAAPVTSSTAVLNGLVNSEGNPTAAWFQWGTTTNYGNTTPITVVAGTNTSAVAVSKLLTGLAFGSYHFQMVASNAAGTAFGSDMSFSVALFTNVASSIPPIYSSSIAWGDFNNDGLLDLLVTGATNGSVSDAISQIWQNLGNGSFSNINASLPAVSDSSVAWGDFDSDGFLDILLTGSDRFGNGLSQIWHNNGDGTFSLTSAGLPGVSLSSVALADFDNDGRLDILLTGTGSSGRISQVWRNQGDGTFANMNVPLPGVSEGSVACSDFDKDGNVDILLTGVGGSGRLTQLWRNNGDGTFFLVNAGLPTARDGSVAWADFDGDGFPDILLSGGVVPQVWHNNHDGTFSNLNLNLPFLGYTTAAVGDFDNDGPPDLILSGSADSTGPGALTQLFRNLGNGSFTNVAVDFPGAWLGSLAWGDFDNDGRLDFLMTGWDTNSNPMTLLWRNLNTQTNNPPAPPTGIATAAGSSGASLSWTAGADAQTPAAGLTYNVRVGTNSGGGQILSPESGLDGFRRVAQAGNAGQRLSTTLRGLSIGTTYYWSVQSVDSSFAGSAFSAEGTFIVGAPGVVTGPSLIASATSEQLTGSVNPNSSDSGSWFEWGTTTNYGNKTEPYLITADNLGFIPVTNLVTGLTPGAVYHYRLVGTNAVGTSLGADSTFSVPLAPSVTTLAATAVVPTSALLNGTVLPNNAPTMAWFQWGTSTSYGATSAPILLSMTNLSSVALSNLLTSLAPSTQYHFLLSASNIAGIGSGGDMPFTTPAPSVPSVTTLAADGITPNRATLHGTAAPNGAATAAWFQWGTTPAYGNNTALFAIGASNLSALAVSNSLSGLAAGTVYYYRLAATNSAGTNFGAGLSLTTLPVTAPTATTLAATAVAASSATLNGAVNPNGADTLAWFQYGTNTSYGSVTPSILVSSNLSAAASLSNSVNGVVAGVVYHFQLVASNSLGKSLGGDLSFLPPLFTSTQSGLPNLLYSSAAWGDFDNDGYQDVLLSGFDGTNVVAQVWRNLGNGSFSNMNAGLPGLFAGAVAWSDYDNDGYLDILLMGADGGNTPTTQLWHNNGNGTFARNTNAPLPGLYFGAVAWGDYDNDGKPDLLLTGADANSAPLAQLWHNNGNGSFSLNTNTSLPQVFASGVAWGDYDKDGRLDLLLSGLTSGAPVSELWHNDGNGVFSLNTNAVFPALYFSSVAWGDYDNDGRLDILLTGNDGTSPNSQVWHNDGNGIFTLNSNAVLPATYQGSAAWGDYDGDGKLDILLSGLDTSGNPLTQILRNNGNGTFSAVNVAMPGAFAGTAIWGDVENNGKLDLLLTGGSTNNSGSPDVPITTLFSNVGPSSNTPPLAPSSLLATVQSAGQVRLSWGPASDSQTPANGLSYNLRIGTTPGGANVLAPAASLANGFRRLPQIGNAQEALTNIVTHLAAGTYYWSVQAIDTSFAGGPFAPDSSFTVGGGTPPILTGVTLLPNGAFQFSFTNQGASFTVLSATNIFLPLSNWTIVGSPSNVAPGVFQFTTSPATNGAQRFFRVRSP